MASHADDKRIRHDIPSYRDNLDDLGQLGDITGRNSNHLGGVAIGIDDLGGLGG